MLKPFFAKAVFGWRQRLRKHAVHKLRVFYWRVMGARFGADTALSKVHITWPHQLAMGHRCTVEHNVYFKFDGIFAPGPKLIFGNDVFVGAGCEFNIRCGLSVGNHCLIASQCYFVDHDHDFSVRTMPMAAQPHGAEAAIYIGDDVWLGAQVVVLKGVSIGRGAIIAAGSVLTHSVGEFEIWAGVPARRIGQRPGAN